MVEAHNEEDSSPMGDSHANNVNAGHNPLSNGHAPVPTAHENVEAHHDNDPPWAMGI